MLFHFSTADAPPIRSGPDVVPATDGRLVLAYEAARDLLKVQDTTLANIRTRASSLLTFAALITSFSAGLGFINTDRTRGAVLSPVGAWVLLAVLAGIGGFVMYVLWPTKQWNFGPNPFVMIERRELGESEDELRLYVVEAMKTGIVANDTVLTRRQNAFRWAVALLLGEVLALVATLTLLR